MTNVCVFVGNLVKDPEYTVTQGGVEITKFTLAVNRIKKGSDGNDADFIRCVCFGKIAKNTADFTAKGSKVAVEARVNTSSYEKDGQKIFTTDFLCNSVQFLTRKEDNQQGGQQQPQQQQYNQNQQQPLNQPMYGGNPNQPQGNFHTGNGQQQQNYQWSGQQQEQKPNYPQGGQDPFANSKGPIEVSGEDLPF